MKKLATSLPLLLLCSLSVLSDRFELTCGMKRKGVKEIPCFPGNLPSVKNAPFLSCCLPETLRAVRVGPGPLQPQQQVVTSWRFQETSGWKGEVETEGVRDGDTHEKKTKGHACLHACVYVFVICSRSMWDVGGPKNKLWCMKLMYLSSPQLPASFKEQRNILMETWFSPWEFSAVLAI